MQFYLADEEKMLALGAKVAKVFTAGILFLNGPLGAGKTTFSRGFLRGYHYQGKVKSPTYTIVESYHLLEKNIFHFDFYRIQDAKELHYIGIEEYFQPENICLIEWPEKAFPLLPAPDIVCHIAHQQTGRLIQLTAKTPQGAEMLQALGDIKGK
jgi:tRNA threonylcarbamoyladenosine biosynthesis protein TsaE